jgi:biotin carboxyl carrier protein
MAAEPTGYRIRVGEREHQVEIIGGGEGEPIRVRVDGHEFEVASAGAHTMRVAPRSGGDLRQLEVSLAEHEGRAREAWLAGVRAKLEVRTEREARLAAALGKSAAGHGSGELIAPMPGRVVKVAIAVGDRVERGAPVLIVEAMKMENELQAPITGRVRSIAVGQGDTVEANLVLCVIEPEIDG